MNRDTTREKVVIMDRSNRCIYTGQMCELKTKGEHGMTDRFRQQFETVSLVEFIYLVFTRMPGESYRRRFRSLLLCPLLHE